MGAGKILTKQGRIVHRSGSNNANNLDKKIKNWISKISYLTVQMVKAVFSELKRKVKFINKGRRHSKIVFQKVFNF